MKQNIKAKAEALRNNDKGKAQFLRFIINGCFSAGVHYGIYFLLQFLIEVNAAYAVGYIVSFIVNYFTTCYFTFRSAPTWKLFVGFSGSHGVNFGLHVFLFWCCMQLDVNRFIAPVVVMGIAMLVQFSILRFVFRHK